MGCRFVEVQIRIAQFDSDYRMRFMQMDYFSVEPQRDRDEATIVFMESSPEATAASAAMPLVRKIPNASEIAFDPAATYAELHDVEQAMHSAFLRFLPSAPLHAFVKIRAPAYVPSLVHRLVGALFELRLTNLAKIETVAGHALTRDAFSSVDIVVIDH
jgi:hypothetical protein